MPYCRGGVVVRHGTAVQATCWPWTSHETVDGYEMNVHGRVVTGTSCWSRTRHDPMRPLSRGHRAGSGRRAEADGRRGSVAPSDAHKQLARGGRARLLTATLHRTRVHPCSRGRPYEQAGQELPRPDARPPVQNVTTCVCCTPGRTLLSSTREQSGSAGPGRG